MLTEWTTHVSLSFKAAVTVTHNVTALVRVTLLTRVYLPGNCRGLSLTQQFISEGIAESYLSFTSLSLRKLQRSIKQQFTINHQFISEGTAELNPSITSLYLRELLMSIHHSPVCIWGNCRGLPLTSLFLRESQGAFQVKFTSRFPLSKKWYCRCLGGPRSSATRFSHWILHKEERSQPAKQTSNWTIIWTLKTASLCTSVMGHCYPILLPCSGCTEPDSVHRLQIVPSNTADCTAAPSRRA